MLEDDTINVVRLMYADALPAQFNLCDCRFANWLIRPQVEPHIVTYLSAREREKHTVQSKLPDKFAVTREGGNPEVGGAEAACGWSKAKTVFALRRYAPGATRLRECRPIIAEEA
jgi:hypothetical protein